MITEEECIKRSECDEKHKQFMWAIGIMVTLLIGMTMGAYTKIANVDSEFKQRTIEIDRRYENKMEKYDLFMLQATKELSAINTKLDLIIKKQIK